jgi:hypothetical protein
VEKLHNEELRDVYASQIIIGIIKSRKDEVSGACGTNVGEEECV